MLWKPKIAGVLVEAPKWANYAVKLPDGQWVWLENKPYYGLDDFTGEAKWQVDDGKIKLVFNCNVDWKDSLIANPKALGASEDEVKTRLLQNAAARYAAALGNIVHVNNNSLIGVFDSGRIVWTRHSSMFMEIIETPEYEYLRVKDNTIAPYWRALPCEESNMFSHTDYVIIRSIRDSWDGSMTPWGKTSFQQGRDRIISPENVHADRIPLYFERHPAAIKRNEATWEWDETDKGLIISEIKWSE